MPHPRPTVMSVAPAMPPLAIWLLRNWGSPRYRESLVGDLIEQRRAGRSRVWCWRQVALALWLARVDAPRSARWLAAIKALILAFGVITLGAGTLAWAESVHGNACRAVSCGGHFQAIPGR